MVLKNEDQMISKDTGDGKFELVVFGIQQFILGAIIGAVLWEVITK